MDGKGSEGCEREEGSGKNGVVGRGGERWKGQAQEEHSGK